MQCSKCGKILADDAVFCSQCGMPVDKANPSAANQILYKLTENKERPYSITVKRESISFAGEFWYLKEKEFVKGSGKQETELIRDFLGMGCLSKRSFKKCLFFVIAGCILEMAKVIVDTLTLWINRVNGYLQWIDGWIGLPGWTNNITNILVILCIIFAVMLFFSKKKMVEISFKDKRICVPQKSMTKSEYHMLYQSIQNAKNMV